MKKRNTLIILGFISLFFAGSCMKTNNNNGGGTDPGPGVDTSLNMTDLQISSSFNWATTKTLALHITLPEGEANEPLRIYTLDETELLFIGYSNSSDIISTEIIVNVQLNAVKVYYGYDRYIPFEIGVEDALIYDFNADLTTPQKQTKADDCGCEGKLRSLTMKYTGQNPATIHVREKKDNKEIFFDTSVDPDEEFTFTGSKSNDDMDKTIYFYVNGNKNATMTADCKRIYYIGDEVGDFTIVAGKSKDELSLCSTESIDCGCEGGLVQMKLRYIGTSASDIIVYEKKGLTQIYSGEVQPNGEFSFTGTKKDGKIDNTIYVYINGSENTEIHTSCSVDIEIGDTYGDFKIAEAYNKNNLSLCGTIPVIDDGGDPDPDPDDGNDGSTTTSIYGSLAYEDLWPGRGDYDFNDLVISYDIAVLKNSNEQVLNISSTFIVYAFGASFHNGFGVEFPNVLPNKVISVTGYQVDDGDVYSLASNGLENGQSSATIIVYDDSYNILQHPGEGLGVNTVHGAPYVTPDTIRVNMVFYEDGSFASGGAITYTELDIGSFNPFIILNLDRTREVHLPNYAPTDLVDETVFGTFHDNSIPANGRYYKTDKNLPWAINVPILFEHPQEKKDIVQVYLKFAEWAESGGQTSQDWYEDKVGYRDESLIYTKSN